METLVELHDNIMYFLVIMLFGIARTLVSITRKWVSNKCPIINKYSNHRTLIELAWTITSAWILILIVFPSFKLLFLIYEVTDQLLTLFIQGHQFPKFINSNNGGLEFDFYLIPESDLDFGGLRMSDVDNKAIIPEGTHARLILSSGDVIHSYACPSLGIKCDAYHGRLNQVSALVNRQGSLFGQCSEICGILHSSMPIAIRLLFLEKYLSWLRGVQATKATKNINGYIKLFQL